MRYAWLIVLAVVATTGCNQAELKKALAEAKSAEAQKDSLLTEVLETTQFVSDLNSELAAWQNAVNTAQRQVNWHFTTSDARTRLRHLYPAY